ncbi:MAG: integral rane protein-like protein [Phycisphaerales bacterium]|nr:integral rane protein-like protein [Phycisphaerales bacterium]
MDAVALPPAFPARSGRAGAAWLFAATVFAGAFLLFQVQPLIGKYVLPWFGGGPAVWTTCMLFFQVLLLGGYAYAHLLASRFRPRAQVGIHLVVLVAALCLLPITPSDRWKPTGPQHPTGQILLLLAAGVGLPYFALSATGPLMQAWFGRVCRGTSPYRLYALSNVGSLLALLSYPFVFEPNLTRRTQALMWSVGLGGFALLCAGCGRLVWWARASDAGADGAPMRAFPVVVNDVAAVSTTDVSADLNYAAPGALAAKAFPATESRLAQAARVGLWVLLPACASTLLLAVTNKLCQDVAVVPFLWILPLAVYLLSFVLTFEDPRWYFRPVWVPATAVALWALCHALRWGISEVEVRDQVLTYAAALFVCCMGCHGELVRLRPPAERLTGFYLAVSAGGALGGLFVSVAAPALFPDFFELQVGLFACGVLVAAALLLDPRSSVRGRPGTAGGGVRPRRPFELARDVVTPLVLVIAVAALGRTLYRNVRTTLSGTPSTRNFYGVLRVYEEDLPDGTLRRLQHGAILHGAQFVDGDRSAEPITYYAATSGVGRAAAAIHERPAPAHIGVVGLGVGTMAAHGRAGDTVRFYEIDPAVRDVATSRFSYLSGSKAAVTVVLGDARLSLEREPSQGFDLLALDAFSSDAIPVHLLTREAFEVYGRHLRPNGILAVHVSNRHLDLAPVVYRLAGLLGYSAKWVSDDDDGGDIARDVSDWILLSRDANALDVPGIRAAERPPPAERPDLRPWTDDDANLYKVLKLGR